MERYPRKMLTQANEDYLKTIYEICQTNQHASTNQISHVLKISPASVTGMLKKLAQIDPPLIMYKSHHGVKLTPYGVKVALELIRHHRLLEMYLFKKLGYDWGEVHEEADLLEHYISEKFEERIAESLGNPSYDPHGDPIPDKNLVLPENYALPLSQLHPGQYAIIRRIENENPDFLHYLDKIGLGLDTEIYVKDHSPFDNNLAILIKNKETSIVLGPGITDYIYVQVPTKELIFKK